MTHKTTRIKALQVVLAFLSLLNLKKFSTSIELHRTRKGQGIAATSKTPPQLPSQLTVQKQMVYYFRTVFTHNTPARRQGYIRALS